MVPFRAFHLLCVPLLAATLFAAGCGSGSDGGAGPRPGDPHQPAPVETFADNEDLAAYIRGALSRSVPSDGFERESGDGIVAPPESLIGAPAAGAPGAGSAESGGGDFTDTNLQVAGVDEADRVKTDGHVLYVAVPGEVRMVQRAADGALSAAGRILVSGTPTGLYLAGDRLLVLFQPRREDFVIPDTDRPYPLTGLLTVDVAAPAAPRILGQLLVEGDSLATRRLSDRLHMVVQFGYWPLVAKLNGGAFGKGMPPLVTGEAGVSRELVGQVSNQLLIPRYYRFDAAGALVDTGDAVSGDQVRRPGDTTGSQLVYVLSTSVADAAGALQAAGFVGTAGLVYASTEAVYILEQDYAVGIPVQPLPAVGAPEPGRITMESAAAARALLNEPGTHVYKFSIASGQAQFSASGVVEGAVLDPFSVNERDGILHVVTVSWEAGGTTTRLSTLRQQGDLLEALGRTGPIAPGEQLYSTRFVGDKAYLVTFLRVDPLHTVDLSDPADPRVVGELEVPGYSEYLHPLGGDHLLAIGREVIDDGFGGQRNGGIQLSVFDVSDMADPQLLHNRIVGGSDSWSEALRNHLAFTFQPATGRLLIPVQTRAWIDTVSPPVWSVADEVLIFGVDVASGIQAQGAIRLPERADRNERFVLRGLLMGEQALAVADDVVAAKPVNALDAPPQQILQLN